MLVDVHCHIEDFNDVDQVIDRAVSKGVKAILNNGSNRESNEKTLELARKYDVVKACLGLFPSDILKINDVSKEIDWIFSQDFFAVGEIGLDGTYGGMDTQEKWFREIVTKSVGKVVLVHTRKAEEKIIEVLEELGKKEVVLHCFCGSLKLVERCVKNGWYFSIPTNVVFSEHFQELVKKLPISKILTETDSPFLSPVKGERNEPMNVEKSVAKIASLKGLDEEECMKMIYMNYRRCFDC